MKITMIAAAALLALAGCATKAPVKTTVIANTVDYAYQKESGKAGIAQVFDLDGNTVVQMRNDAGDGVAIIDEHGISVPFTKTGQYYVLQRQTHQFTVVLGNERATVTRSGKKPSVDVDKDPRTPMQPAAFTPASASPSAHEYSIKTILASLPNENMASLADDIVQREKYVKALEYLQAQLDELKVALGMGKAVQTNTKQQRIEAQKLRTMKKRVSAKKARADAALSASPCSDPSASIAMDDNTIAKMRADVARGLAPKSCLDILNTALQASAPTTP